MISRQKISFILILLLSTVLTAYTEGPGALAGARIVVEQPHGAHFEDVSDRSGNFSIGKIPPGSYNIKVYAPAGAKLSAELKCRLTIEGLRNGRFDQTFTAEQLASGTVCTKAEIMTGSVSGRVTLER